MADSEFQPSEKEQEMLAASRERRAAGGDDGSGQQEGTSTGDEGKPNDHEDGDGTSLELEGGEELPKGEEGAGGGGDGDGKPGEEKADLELSEKETPENVSGLDFEAYTKEFNATGTLSEETTTDLLPKLEKMGLGPEYLATFLIGMKAQAEEVVNSKATQVELAGGPKEAASMVAWANKNLSPAERTAFNTSLRAGPESMKFAIAGVQALQAADTGRAPVHNFSAEGNSPDNSGSSSAIRITSRSEFQALQRSSDYKTNKAGYRDKVDRALSKAQQTGTYNQQA